MQILVFLVLTSFLSRSIVHIFSMRKISPQSSILTLVPNSLDHCLNARISKKFPLNFLGECSTSVKHSNNNKVSSFNKRYKSDIISNYNTEFNEFKKSFNHGFRGKSKNLALDTTILAASFKNKNFKPHKKNSPKSNQYLLDNDIDDDDDDDDLDEDDDNGGDDEDEDEDEDEDDQEYDEIDRDDESYDPADSSSGPIDVNNYGDVLLRDIYRLRRNRKSDIIRSMLQENYVTVSNLVYPIFIHNENSSIGISSAPNIKCFSRSDLVREIEECMRYGLRSFILFPRVEQSKKSVLAEESYNEENLISRTISFLKGKYGDRINLFSDVALDAYNLYGHDGIVDIYDRNPNPNSNDKDKRVENNELQYDVMNDETVLALCKQAICHAKAGVDVVAPSDMMDGRVSAIRHSLDSEGFTKVNIMSYACKFDSSLYSCFRDAANSSCNIGDKKTYQLNPSNSRESIIEAQIDEDEGADILVVKPGMGYLDILSKIRSKTNLPLAIYQVLGEYRMIKTGCTNFDSKSSTPYLNEKKIVLEFMKCFKRAGADIIITYFAKDIARWIYDDKKSHFSTPAF